MRLKSKDMKAYTNLEQSKKLAEILPLESADMCWGIDDDTMQYDDKPYLNPYKDYTAKEYYIPCWSLAALLEVLPRSLDDRYNFELGNPLGNSDWYIIYVDTNHLIKNAVVHDNLIDAAVEMIFKLHEQKLI